MPRVSASKGPRGEEIRPQRLSAREHRIRPDDISPGALRVVEGLESAGFQAYLVGGCIRDLLAGGKPKDFDIATSATPEQIKGVFRRARIIGRRFRIVHVRMGREVLEVTTFRAHHDEGEGGDHEAASAANGMLLRDNVYGDMQSDALRRDFSMNGLYYSPTLGEIFDFCGGMGDIDRRLVRMIGDPETRYKEDPVRMLRALRLAAKLRFAIEVDTGTAIEKLGEMLANVPPARLFDEALKLFMGGYGADSYRELRHYDLFRQLFPESTELLAADPSADPLIRRAAENTDKRIHAGKRVTPAFIFAVILWPAVCRLRQQLEAEGIAPIPALQQAGQWVISRQVQRVAIPRRFTLPIREIWDLQLRLPRRRGKQPYRLLERPRFRAAYDFLLLREEAGEDLQGLGEWWTRFQDADSGGREAMLQQLGGGTGGKKRKRRPRQRKAPGDD